MNESIAVKSGVDGDPESCNCGTPYVGQGCFVAASGFSAGISPDPTANFLKVSGDCHHQRRHRRWRRHLHRHRHMSAVEKAEPQLQKSETEARAPLPAVSYIYVAAPNPADRSDNSLVKTIIEDGPDSSCNAQGLRGSPDAYISVSPACCDKTKWDKAGYAANTFPLNSSTSYNGVDYSCPVIALSPNMYVRGWTGCEAGVGAWAESCQPLTYSGSWPMPDAATANQNWEQGTYESCGCHAPRVLGDGCYIGATFPGFAYYFTIDSSTCASSLGETESSEMEEVALAPAPAPEGSFLQYYRTADHNLLAENMPECNFFSAEDVGKIVPDACCDPSAWPGSVPLITQGPDTRLHIGGDTTDRCYARERVPAPGTYVRNFFGCYQGEITAYEECVPDGLGLGKGYPMNESIAVKSGVDGDPESCNCGTPYVGQGCFVAASGFSAGISPDPTANFLKVSGNCDEGSLSLQQTREQEGSKKNDPLVSSNPQCSWRSPIPAPTPPETPTPAPPTKGYTGPPKNPGMTYMGVGDITEIADYNPECVSSFCDETIGTKMPDRCCDIDSWRNAAGDLPPSWWGGDGHESDILYMPDDPNKSPVTCYSRVAPGPFDGMVTGGYVQWIRNYIGCENGELRAQ